MKTESSRLTLGTHGVILASLGLILSTAAFRCPGPDPSAAPATGGSGGAGGGTTTSTSSTSTVSSSSVSSSTGCNPMPSLDTDPKNCGACGRPCSTADTMGVSCASGVCDSTCQPGRLNLKHPQAGMADDGCETHVHRVFVTSQLVTADMNGMPGGAAAGDAICQAAAVAANILGPGNMVGKWKAWLSDTTTFPAIGLNIDMGPYVLLDMTKVADSWQGLVTMPLLHQIDRDELGNSGLMYTVWTGTTPDGHPTMQQSPVSGMPITNCLNWTTKISDADFAAVGYTSQVGPGWSQDAMPLGCYSTGCHLYCFEQ